MVARSTLRDAKTVHPSPRSGNCTEEMIDTLRERAERHDADVVLHCLSVACGMFAIGVETLTLRGEP